MVVKGTIYSIGRRMARKNCSRTRDEMIVPGGCELRPRSTFDIAP